MQAAIPAGKLVLAGSLRCKLSTPRKMKRYHDIDALLQRLQTADAEVCSSIGD